MGTLGASQRFTGFPLISSIALDYDLSARTGRLAPCRSYGPMAPNAE